MESKKYFPLKKGYRFTVSGDSADLGIEDYNVRVDTPGVVLETPRENDEKVLVSLEYIDHEANVAVMIRRSALKLTGVIEAEFESVWDGGTVIATKCKVNFDTREVYDIERVDANGVCVLDEERVVIDERSYPVFNKSEFEIKNDDFWYE